MMSDKKVVNDEVNDDVDVLSFDNEEIEVSVRAQERKDAKKPAKIKSKINSKKGRTPWNPGNNLDIKGKTAGFNYRWCSKDPDNLRIKEEQGWIYVGGLSGVNAEHERRISTSDGGPMASGYVEYRDAVLMALPDERLEARKEYQEKRVTDQLRQSAKGNLVNATKKLGGADAPELHGEGLTFD